MSIKNVNKNYTIQDSTTGIIKDSIEHRFFTDFGEFETKLSIGDFLLLQHVKSILFNNDNVSISIGFKE